MSFPNATRYVCRANFEIVSILVLVDVFPEHTGAEWIGPAKGVSILVLVDVFPEPAVSG